MQRLHQFVGQFRETRLYAQLVAAAILTAAVVGITLLPLSALNGARAAARWTVTYDHDFRGQFTRLRDWVHERGGVKAAAEYAWMQTRAKVEPWLVGLTGLPSASAPGAASPSPPAQASSPSAVPAPSQPVVGASGRPQMPVEGAILIGFGWVPLGGQEEFYEGMGIAAPLGTPVGAAEDGIVLAVRLDERIGRLVEIDHGRVIAVYAQLGETRVDRGERVRRGTEVGRVGTPVGVGRTLPPYLHFEIRTPDARIPVDPATYLGLGGRKL